MIEHNVSEQQFHIKQPVLHTIFSNVFTNSKVNPLVTVLQSPNPQLAHTVIVELLYTYTVFIHIYTVRHTDQTRYYYNQKQYQGFQSSKLSISNFNQFHSIFLTVFFCSMLQWMAPITTFV